MNRRSFLVAAATTLAATPFVPAIAGGHGRLGKFVAKNSYATAGTAEVAGNTVNLLDDFSFAGAPDPKVALGKDGQYDSDTLMGLLKSLDGSSSYEIPAGINPDDYNEVWIWCERFNVPLAVAELG